MQEDQGAYATENAVRVFLAEAASAWNQRDLDHFISLYAKGDKTFFVNKFGIFQGEQEIRRAYANNFGKGRLGLYLTKVVMHTTRHLYVVGTYSREVQGRPVTGNFTLLLNMQADGKLRMISVHES